METGFSLSSAVTFALYSRYGSKPAATLRTLFQTFG